jgi:hypothetical protein
MTRHQQPDLFGNAEPILADPVIGLLVLLPDECRQCRTRKATIGEGAGPHVAALPCDCGKHRGWLPREVHEFLTTLIYEFGRPVTPIKIRRSKTAKADAAPAQRDLEPEN